MTTLHPDVLETALDELTTFYPDWRTWPVETIAGCLAQAVNAREARVLADPGVCGECKRPGGGHEPWCADPGNTTGMPVVEADIHDEGCAPGGRCWCRAVAEQTFTVAVFDQAGHEAARWYERGYSPMGCLVQLSGAASHKLADRLAKLTGEALGNPAHASWMAALMEIADVLGIPTGRARLEVPPGRDA